MKDDFRDELHRYTASILKEWDSPAILINSVEDHIHILFSLSKNHAMSKIVEEVKKGSSAQDQGGEIGEFSLAEWLWRLLGESIRR